MNHTVENAVRPRSNGAVYTPRTPRMRQRQRFDLTPRLEEDEDIDDLGLAILVDQTWNIYAVSLLFDFQPDDVTLKLYSKKLREEIANTLSRENVTYNAKFSIMENVTSQPNQRTSTIKIEVLAKDNSREESTEKCIYNGILLSWNTKRVESNVPNSVRLPLLLCRGTRNCINAVHSIIGHMFDCLITELSVDEDDLSWFIPIIIMTAMKKEQHGEIQMQYTIPELPATDTITVKFHIPTLKKILSAIVTFCQNDVSLHREHIEMFYKVLYSQILNSGGLQLGLCTLRKISLPGVTIMGNKMKIKNEEIMDRILLYLNEKSLDRFHTLEIDI